MILYECFYYLLVPEKLQKFARQAANLSEQNLCLNGLFKLILKIKSTSASFLSKNF